MVAKLVFWLLATLGVLVLILWFLHSVGDAAVSAAKDVLDLDTPSEKQRNDEEEEPLAETHDGQDFFLCSDEACGHMEYWPAKYCSRCGERLDDGS